MVNDETAHKTFRGLILVGAVLIMMMFGVAVASASGDDGGAGTSGPKADQGTCVDNSGPGNAEDQDDKAGNSGPGNAKDDDKADNSGQSKAQDDEKTDTSGPGNAEDQYDDEGADDCEAQGDKESGGSH